jgi:4-alpha-glucanotransferase
MRRPSKLRLVSDKQLLGRVADAHGIEPEYTDTWGKVHHTPEDVAREILESLGVSTESDTALQLALDEQSADYWTRALDGTLVVRDDTEFFDLRIPASRDGSSVKLEFQWEGGTPENPNLEHHWFWLPELKTTSSATVGETQYLCKRVPLPKAMRLGYHHLRAYWMKQPELEVFAEAEFIVCPKRARAVQRRMAGLALSLYGLRSGRNWGCGDFTDLVSVVEFFAPAGAAFIALNPLHAIANRSPYNTSPYLPQCALYRNFIYLDVEKIGDPMLSDVERQEVDELRSSEFVEYERVASLKLAALTRIFERFAGDSNFDAFIQREGQYLEDYAVYCALDEEMHRRDPDVWLWTQWPAEYHDPRGEAVQTFAKEHRGRVDFFKFLQWHLTMQAHEAHARALKLGMAIGLYHDLALATDRYGADLWSLRPFYARGARVGAPPDDVAPSGQDWGFPPPDRDAHRHNAYRLFAQSIRKAAEAGGALRIDHVMRFFRLYWIPDARDAKHGAYVKDYAEDLLGILALESVRGNFIVVGEDLGTVTGEVRAALADAGILSYKLLWFEREGDGRFLRPEEYPEHALASTSTHDLPTLAGFPLGRDIEVRRSAGLVDEDSYRTQWASRDQDKRRLEQSLADAGFPGDPIGYLLATPSLLALVNQEDLSGETEQQNLPGSTWQYPNWRRKMKVRVDEFAPLADRFFELVKRSGR